MHGSDWMDGGVHDGETEIRWPNPRKPTLNKPLKPITMTIAATSTERVPAAVASP